MLHEKLTEILKAGLLTKELLEDVLYSADLVKALLALSESEDFKFRFEETSTHESYFPYLIDLANFMKKLAEKQDSEVRQMMDSMPEWA